MTPTCDACGQPFDTPTGCSRAHLEPGPCRRCWEAGTTHGACDCERLDRDVVRRWAETSARFALKGRLAPKCSISARTSDLIVTAPAVDRHGTLLGPVLLAMNRRIVEAVVRCGSTDPAAKFVVQCSPEAAAAIRREVEQHGEHLRWQRKPAWLGVPVLQTAAAGTGWRICRLQPEPARRPAATVAREALEWMGQTAEAFTRAILG